MTQSNYTAEIIIKRTVGQVFEFASNIKNFPLWAGASDVEVISETPNRVGSVYKVTFSTFLTKSSVNVEITEYKFPNFFSYKDSTKMILYHYVLEQAEEDAKVTLNCALDAKPFLLSRLKLDKLLTDLKKYLETHDQI